MRYTVEYNRRGWANTFWIGWIAAWTITTGVDYLAPSTDRTPLHLPLIGLGLLLLSLFVEHRKAVHRRREEVARTAVAIQLTKELNDERTASRREE